MKKIIVLALLIFTFLSINSANATNVDCNSINTDINNYSTYKVKVDNLFTQLNKKSETTKNKYYSRLESLTSNYLSKLDIIKQKKAYTVIGYLSCENERNLGKMSVLKDYGNGLVIKTDGEKVFLYYTEKLVYTDDYVWNNYSAIDEVQEGKSGFGTSS